MAFIPTVSVASVNPLNTTVDDQGVAGFLNDSYKPSVDILSLSHGPVTTPDNVTIITFADPTELPSATFSGAPITRVSPSMVSVLLQQKFYPLQIAIDKQTMEFSSGLKGTLLSLIHI